MRLDLYRVSIVLKALKPIPLVGFKEAIVLEILSRLSGGVISMDVDREQPFILEPLSKCGFIRPGEVFRVRLIVRWGGFLEELIERLPGSRIEECCVDEVNVESFVFEGVDVGFDGSVKVRVDICSPMVLVDDRGDVRFLPSLDVVRSSLCYRLRSIGFGGVDAVRGFFDGAMLLERGLNLRTIRVLVGHLRELTALTGFIYYVANGRGVMLLDLASRLGVGLYPYLGFGFVRYKVVRGVR